MVIGTISLRTEADDESDLNDLRDWLAEQVPGLISWGSARETRLYVLTCVKGKQVFGVEVEAENEAEARESVEDEYVVAHVEEVP